MAICQDNQVSLYQNATILGVSDAKDDGGGEDITSAPSLLVFRRKLKDSFVSAILSGHCIVACVACCARCSLFLLGHLKKFVM